MIDKFSQFHRWYREGRRRYHLAAVDAIAYARDRQLLWLSDFVWDIDVDVDAEGLIVFIREDAWETAPDQPIIVDSLGGVTQPFTVSDHGNISTDLHSPFLIGLAAEMVRNYERQD